MNIYSWFSWSNRKSGRHNIKQRWMSIKSLFCSITALVASSMGISLGAINSLKILPLILSYPSPKQKDILLETLNIWWSLQQPTRTRNLCRRCLHKFRGRTIMWSWIKEAKHEFHCNSRKDSSAPQIAFQIVYCTRLQTKYSFPGVGISP